MKATSVWSYGGGVQSVAIACLIKQGRLPAPDMAVIADTGREAETTWTYLAENIQPMLDFEIHVAPHSLSTVDLYSHKGKLLIPAVTTKNGLGRLPTFCSTEWKRRVVLRWARSRGVKTMNMWIGISCDEVGRMKSAAEKWVDHVYPLIDLRLRRSDCNAIIEAAGLPPAPKSACWMCPFRSVQEWRALTDGDMAKAVQFDAEIRRVDPDVWLRNDAKPLTEPMDSLRRPESPLFDIDACDGGMCWV